MSLKPKTITDWTIIVIFLAVLLSGFVTEAQARTVGVHGGHWSHHWTSDNVTNERHRWIGVRAGYVTAGHAYNSHRQPGFSGELWYVGAIKDWTAIGNINRWHGDVIIRGSAGLMHGYTQLGGHDPDKPARVHPYAAVGVLYQQPFDKTWRWEAGATQMGDATIPTAGLEARF